MLSPANVRQSSGLLLPLKIKKPRNLRGLKLLLRGLGFATAKQCESRQAEAAERKRRGFGNGGDTDVSIIDPGTGAIAIHNEAKAEISFCCCVRVVNTHRSQAFGNRACENLAADQLGAIKRNLIRRAIILRIV